MSLDVAAKYLVDYWYGRGSPQPSGIEKIMKRLLSQILDDPAYRQWSDMHIADQRRIFEAHLKRLPDDEDLRTLIRYLTRPKHLWDQRGVTRRETRCRFEEIPYSNRATLTLSDAETTASQPFHLPTPTDPFFGALQTLSQENDPSATQMCRNALTRILAACDQSIINRWRAAAEGDISVLTIETDHRPQTPSAQLLPWELLLNQFQTQSAQTNLRINRTIRLSRQTHTHTFAKRPQILWITGPDSGPGFGRELEQVLNQRQKTVDIHVLQNATLADIRNRLGQHIYDGIHLSAHGDRDENGQGVLELCDHRGEKTPITGATLAKTLAGYWLKFLILNACGRPFHFHPNEHRTFPADQALPAADLIQTVPNIVCMQTPIAETDAGVFSQAFYQTLIQAAANRTTTSTPHILEAAVTAGRQALGANQWVPMLFQGVADV